MLINLKELPIFDPKTEKDIDPEDTDALISAIEHWDAMIARSIGIKRRIEDILIAKVSDLKTKTRRVRGEKRTAIVTMPDDYQDVATLRKIVEDKRYKVIWPQLIRVSGYAIKMREYKTALNTKGTDEWNEYRDRVKSALRDPTARPRVKIET